MFGSFGFSDFKFNSVVIEFDVVYWPRDMTSFPRRCDLD